MRCYKSCCELRWGPPTGGERAVGHEPIPVLHDTVHPQVGGIAESMHRSRAVHATKQPGFHVLTAKFLVKSADEFGGHFVISTSVRHTILSREC